MNDLKTQVSVCSEKLKAVWTELHKPVRSSLPRKCQEQWTKRAMLYRILEGTSELFPVRSMAWKTAKSILLDSNIKDAEKNIVKYGNNQMTFSVARHLSLTSYMTTTWSVYDRLANVCGRIAAISELSENPRQNPKACQDFLGKKDILGFSAHLPIKQAYAWPMKVTYKIRNWLVHEGYDEGGTPLFKSERIADGFILHDDASKYIERICGFRIENGKINNCCLKAFEERWLAMDLLEILPSYHAEIDTLFEGLLKWSVMSFIEQIKAFTDRDRQQVK